MIQLIDSLPFNLETSLNSLKSDWSRFQNGLVTFSEIPNAICGVFECEAEIIEQECEDDLEEGSGNEKEKIIEKHKLDHNGNASNSSSDTFSNSNSDINSIVPSGNGQLILTVRYYTTASSGWSVDYKNVLLHAISKPDASRPSIYLQLSCNRIIDTNGTEIDLNRSDVEEEPFVEVNLFVENDATVDKMFVALSECASLHPCADEDESDSEDESREERKKSKILDETNEERFEDAIEK